MPEISASLGLVGADASLPEIVNVLVQIGIPLLISLVTKASTSNKVKWSLLAALTGLNTALLAYNPGQDALSLILTALFGVVVSLGAHHGILVPTGLTGRAEAMLVKDKPEPEHEVGVESHPEECGEPEDIADVTDTEDTDEEEYVDAEEEASAEAGTEADAEAEATDDQAEAPGLLELCQTKHKPGSKAARACTLAHI